MTGPWAAGWQLAGLADWFFITLLGTPPTEAYFAWYPAALLSGNAFMLWSGYAVMRRRRCGWMLFGSIGATLVACTLTARGEISLASCQQTLHSLGLTLSAD